MPSPPVSALVYTEGWNEDTRAHEALNWLETYVNGVVDVRKWSDVDPRDYLTDDTVYVKASGDSYSGVDSAWGELQMTYAFYTSYYHDAREIIIWETENGWQLWGTAWIYANVVGQPNPEQVEQSVKDRKGTEWDVGFPAAFHFTFVKQDGRIKLSKSEIFADGAATMIVMFKRGIVK